MFRTKVGKKAAIGAGAIVMMLAAVSCGSSDSPEPADDASSSASESATASASDSAEPEEADAALPVVSEGKLSIATSGNYPPYTYPDDDGGYTGYDIEICSEVARGLGLEPEINVVDFNTAMAGINIGNYDVVCSAVQLTEERQKSDDFYLSEPTLKDGITLVVVKDSPIQSINDIVGQRLGGVTGSSTLTAIEEEVDGDVEVITFPGQAEATLGLKAGRVDGVSVTAGIGAYIAKGDPELRVIPETVRPVGEGLVITRQADLRDAINEQIESLLSSGKVEELQNEYFGQVALP